MEALLGFLSNTVRNAFGFQKAYLMSKFLYTKMQMIMSFGGDILVVVRERKMGCLYCTSGGRQGFQRKVYNDDHITQQQYAHFCFCPNYVVYAYMGWAVLSFHFLQKVCCLLQNTIFIERRTDTCALQQQHHSTCAFMANFLSSHVTPMPTCFFSVFSYAKAI